MDIQVLLPIAHYTEVRELGSDPEFRILENYNHDGITVFRIETTEEYYLLLRLKYGNKNVWIR